MTKVCMQCGQQLGLLKAISDQFCSDGHAELYREELSQLAFQRVMRGQAPARSPQPPTSESPSEPRPDFSGKEWAQSASTLAPPAAPTSSAILLPEARKAEQSDVRTELAAMLRVEPPVPPAEELAGEMETVEAAVAQSSVHAAHGNVWGRAARTTYFEGAEAVAAADVVAAAKTAPAAFAVLPVTAAPPRRRNRTMIAMSVAAGLSAVAIGALLAGPLVKPLVEPVEAPQLKLRIPQAPALTALSLPQPVRAKAEAPIASPAAGASHASLEASDASWVVACADNKVLFAKLFTAGMKESIPFTTRAVVKIGRSNAVQLSLNDHVLNGPGGAGQVSVTELTPGGSRALAKGAPDDCTSGR